MRQVVRVLTTYSADLFGISSVLYELGGLVVMHDASGCNSTYNTHDEPRWYTMDSMVYISGLVENDVILGNDTKLIEEICEIADETHPKFIAISAAMIAHFMSVDIRGIAKIVEKRTGIPTFAFDTNAMNTYISGGNMAYKALLERFCPEPEPTTATAYSCHSDDPIKVNLLGITPLDFSIVGNVEALHRLLEDNGFEVVSCMTMGCSIEDITKAGDADVNLLCSSIAEDGARLLEDRYGTPFVTGLPLGITATARWLDEIRCIAGKPGNGESQKSVILPEDAEKLKLTDRVTIIGEPVFASSLRQLLEDDLGYSDVRIICPTERTLGLLRDNDIHSKEEYILEAAMAETDLLIADPIYNRLLKHNSRVRFVNLPHEAYSGRMYRSHIPVFIGRDFTGWLVNEILYGTEIGTNDIMQVNEPFVY